jgi:catechol 2,3-dioxygenase-like lactoylglutathione lyase family enzyme
VNKFKMGSLNHVHLAVPDKVEAAKWFEKLGFEVVKGQEMWSDNPMQPTNISADGGHTALALFNDNYPHAKSEISKAIAFTVKWDQFLNFVSLLDEDVIADFSGERVTPSSVYDHLICFSYYFSTPYGYQFELTSYDYEIIKEKLILPRGITPILR